MVNAFRWMVFVIGLVVVIGSIMVTSAGYPIIEIYIYSPSDGETVNTDTIAVFGRAFTGTDGVVVESVTVNGVLSSGTTFWSADILLQEGPNRITAVATTDIGNAASETITVFYKAPTPTLTQTGSISINTTPSGAEVYLDDFFAGITPITLEDVTVGYHKATVSKEGYHSLTKEIYLSTGKTRELNIELKPITGSIIVNSTPSGASVYLDDVDMKATTPSMLSEVVVGPHTIMLTKSGYFDAIRNVSVPADGLLSLHETLISCGYINISSNPPGANVYIDGNDTGETTPVNISKVAGNHTIKLTKFGYDDVIGNVSVSVGETISLHENLIGYGSLSISSSPSGANVFLDGNYTGETDLDILKVVEGWHTIKLTKQDYADVEKVIHVSAGKSTLVGETLSVQWAVNILTIADLIFIILILIIGPLIFMIIVKVSKRKRDAFSKSIMKEENVKLYVESGQKIEFTKRKEIILLNSQEWIKHKDYAKINPLYEKAQELEKRGENKESIEAYEEIIDINEYYKKAWEGLERNYNALGESEKRYSASKKIRSITEFIDFATNAAQKINLQQFNLQNLDFFDNLFWSFQPQINILLGKNGYGKTHLLRLLISLLQKDEDISSEFFKESKSNSFVRCDLERNNIAKAIYRTKTVFKELYLFSIDAEFEDDSNNGIIAKELRNKFKIESFPISANAKVTKENDDKWAIADGEKIYIVKKEEGKLNIYKESIGKVPVLAIPDMRLVDKSRTKIEPLILEKHIRESGAYHFLYEKPYEEVIQNFLYGLCNRYMDKGKSFEQPLFQLLHKVVRELTDKEFKFNEIVAIGAKFEIKVITEGNPEKPLPLQKASQGTLSVLSIFGLIYDYLMSVFPDTPEEELLKKPAIVFIDELDAHLHPSWQQRIIGLLRDSFPNVQFIVTAHSPLVVAGCYENEVAVLRKGENGFKIENIEEHFIGTSTSELYKKIFEIEDIDDTYLYYATQLSLQKDNSVRIKELESNETLKEDEEVELNNLYKYDYYVNEIAQRKKEKQEKDYKLKIAALEAKIRDLEIRLNKEEPQ